jgi:glutamyl-tRNA synthetase
LHVGGLRSALFNYLWARHTGGAFVLRIEDTDRARLVSGAIEQIQASLDALGITPDESPAAGGNFGPYLQSERLGLYRTHADQLVASGALYPCWCTPERLDGLRQAAQKAGVAFKYDRHCLIPENQGQVSQPHVLRFKIPETPQPIGWNDEVRGHLEFRADTLDDFVALKADGYPTYHFANVVDDHLMRINYVLRADEWIPSTPKHLLLFEAFSWDTPKYGHLPAVQGPGGTKKLSKRDGAKSAQEYLQDGYLPEALMSFLASLGWNDGTTQEVFTPDELIATFTLNRVQKSPAKFDIERLTWINGLLIRQMAPQALLERSSAFWPANSTGSSPAYRLAVLGLVQERLKQLSELPELTGYFFADPTVPAELMAKAMHPFMNSDEATFALQESISRLDKLDTFDEAKIEKTLSELEAEITQAAVAQGAIRQNSRKQLYGLVRTIVTGAPSSPPLFPMLAVLGKETTLRRLKATQLSSESNR